MNKSFPPYMNATGNIGKILDKIKVAATPPRFTQDYLAAELKFPGGGAKAFIPFAKKLGLLNSDGTPSELYKQFRNKGSSKAAMAQAIRTGYAQLYSANEYAHSLSREDLEGLILEVTGAEKTNKTVTAVLKSFESLKAFANFDAELKEENTPTQINNQPTVSNKEASHFSGSDQIELGLSYTINLVLPKTSDVAIYNAIFRSLRENLLRK
ncbi:hypothetical protein LP7551_03736 [Roseibium album]|nr:hypothetical protein LP7551_03736 [Roseibium album]